MTRSLAGFWKLLAWAAVLLALAAAFWAVDSAQQTLPPTRTRPTIMPKTKDASGNNDPWRDKLTPEQYHVAREKGTERAFTGKYWNNHQDGVYKCVCCGEPLFDSSTKFESGTGWPSFTQPISDQNVATESDSTLFMTRTEVLCRKCSAHLGHVFEDGPAPTGLRYCLNSASLDFEPRSGAAKADETAVAEKE